MKYLLSLILVLLPLSANSSNFTITDGRGQPLASSDELVLDRNLCQWKAMFEGQEKFFDASIGSVTSVLGSYYIGNKNDCNVYLQTPNFHFFITEREKVTTKFILNESLESDLSLDIENKK